MTNEARGTIFFPADFLARQKTYAELIAAQQGHPVHDLATLLRRFTAEYKEYKAAEHAIDELPDLLYYLAYIKNVCPDQFDSVLVEKDINLFVLALGQSSYTLEEIIIATDVKYQHRAAGEPKNVAAERVAMMAAIQERRNELQQHLYSGPSLADYDSCCDDDYEEDDDEHDDSYDW